MIIVAENASNVWIDHCTFQNAIDEILYVGSGSTLISTHIAPHGVTISWNHFLISTDCWRRSWADKSFLFQIHLVPEDVDDDHHASPQPLSNDIFGTPRRVRPRFTLSIIIISQTAVALELRFTRDGQFYSENEIFAGSALQTLSNDEGGSNTQRWDPRRAANVKVVNPWLINGATVEQLNPSTIFIPSSYYSYTRRHSKCSTSNRDYK